MSASWISAFRDYGSAWYVNDFWLEWGGVFAISICLARQVYHEAAPGKYLYPNLYMMPVAGPGTGKGELIEAMRSVLNPLEIEGRARFHFAPNSATRAAVLDYMADNLVSRNLSGKLYISHECIALNEELANLIPENDTWYLSTLNELYDCRRSYEARTRTHGRVQLEMPYAAVFAAAQPQFLALTFPEQAWGMGFMSRTIMVFSGERKKREDLFATMGADHTAQAELTSYLQQVMQLSGRMHWRDDAKAKLNAWYKADMPPKPDHPRLVSYCNRRIMHTYKLAMIMAVSDGLRMQVQGDDVDAAIDLLVRTEMRMPQIFLEMGGSAMHSTMLDVANIIKQYFVKYQKPLEEAKVIQLLAQRIAPNQITMALNTMITTGLLKTTGPNIIGQRQLLPGTVPDQKLGLYE